MKIRRLPVVQMGIRMENNLLDLTIQNQDLTSEDLAELLDSYRKKKKYHKLRNDEYVDLEKNESVEALMLLLETAGFGGILADDMGLGKTLQIISLILSYREANPESKSCVIVLCPTSLVYNWIEEIERFAPELKAVAVTGTKKQRAEIIKNCEQYEVLVTSYDLLKRDIDMYEELQFSHQIIDEAQYIKNAGSAAAKSVKLINATNRFALLNLKRRNLLMQYSQEKADPLEQ